MFPSHRDEFEFIAHIVFGDVIEGSRMPEGERLVQRTEGYIDMVESADTVVYSILMATVYLCETSLQATAFS